MSKISLSPDANGTGIFTIASPGTSTNRTLTLPDDTGTIVTNSGNQAGSFTTLNTSGQVVFNDAGADVDFRVEGDTDANLLFVDASTDRVGIGTSSPAYPLDITKSVVGTLRVQVRNTDSSAGSQSYFTLGNDVGASEAGLLLAGSTNSTFGNRALVVYNSAASPVTVWTSNTERGRFTSGGYFKASDTASYLGIATAYHEFNNTQDVVLWLRSTDAANADRLLGITSSTSASSSYFFGEWYSGNLGDKEFGFRGDGNAYADGSWNGSGADYAEYFESATGEAIPRGTTVVLENNKVRAATAEDPASSIIGVVRPKEFGKGSMVVGNLAWNMWTDKYITDDFGVYEMEDHDVVEWEETITDEEGNTSTKPHSYESWNIPEGVTVPADATRKTHDEKGKKFQHRKLNPNYDPAVEYTPREERPEWLIIGLLGQVPVLKGQPVGDRWVKMRDVSETVEEWMIR